jgi:hypothetical protein
VITNPASLAPAGGAHIIKETRTMLQRMEADILFLDPANLGPATAVLTAAGFEVENLTGPDWIDEAGPTVFCRIRVTSELGDRFMDWVQDLIEPFDGDCIEAGLADPPPQAA